MATARKNAPALDHFLIVNETKAKPPRLAFALIKEAVLGTSYDLSLIFASDEKIAELNKKYRNKDGTTDVLSFPISETSGEIYISIQESERQAPLFGYTNFSEKFIGFLFIHGLLHLKGYSHGSTMEQEEMKFVKRFHLSPSSETSSHVSKNKWQEKSQSASTSAHIKSKQS